MIHQLLWKSSVATTVIKRERRQAGICQAKTGKFVVHDEKNCEHIWSAVYWTFKGKPRDAKRSNIFTT
jgi:hypothetical protein